MNEEEIDIENPYKDKFVKVIFEEEPDTHRQKVYYGVCKTMTATHIFIEDTNGDPKMFNLRWVKKVQISARSQDEVRRQSHYRY